MVDPLRFTPWAGSPGLIETVTLGPPVGSLAALAGGASFAGAGSVGSATITGALVAQAQAAGFAGGGTLAEAPITGDIAASAQVAAFSGGGSVGSATPLTILGSLAWWFRPGVGVTIATGVSQWADQSGNGVNIAQATGGSQPTVQSAALNGFDAIRGDGTDDVLSATWARVAPGTQPFYIWLVLRQVSWTLNDFVISDMNAGSTAGFSLRCRTPTPTLQQQNISLVNANNGGVLGSFRRTEAQFGNSTADYLKIGATAVTGAASGNTAGGGKLSLFGNVDLGASANVDIVEAFCFLGTPSAGLRADLDSYCTATYGAGLV